MARLIVKLIIFCLFGQFAFAQRHVAEDITDQITASEVDYARQTVADCLAGQAIDLISDYSARSTEGGQSLHVTFDWREHGPKQKFLFSAEFYRNSPSDKWTLGRVMTTGEVNFEGQNQPIYIAGYLGPQLVHQLIAEAKRSWTEITTNPFEIVGIISNQNVPLYCDVEGSEFDNVDIIFDVSIINLAPRKGAPPKAAPNSISLGSYSSMDNSYVIRLTRDDTGKLVTTEAECQSGGVCDLELLTELRGSLTQPTSQSAIDNRLRAAMAVVPTEFREAKVKHTQRTMFGPYELFSVQFGEVSISPRRTESSSVSCGRPAGSQEAWQCRHQTSAGRQFVHGQTTPISLMLAETLPETDVDAIVAGLRKELQGHPEIDSANGEIQFSTIAAVNEGFQASFMHGRAGFTALFSFEGGAVHVNSLEVNYRLDENNRLIEQR